MMRSIKVAGQSQRVAAALNAEVILLVEVFTILGLLLLSSIISNATGSRREAGAGDSARLADRRRVMKGQRSEVLGDGAVAAEEILLDRLLHTGERRGFAGASEEILEHFCWLIAITEGGVLSVGSE